MYANIRHRTFHHGKAAEAAKQIEAGATPIASQVPGFISFTVVQTGEDTLTTIGLFENQAAAEAAGPQVVAWVDQHLSDSVAGPAEISNGPVLVHHTK
jgi:hypothetical protein